MASRVLRSRVLLSAPWSPMRPVRAAGLSDMSRWRFGMNPSCTPTESRMGCDSAGASSRVGAAIRGMLRLSSRWGMALIASDGNGEASCHHGPDALVLVGREFHPADPQQHNHQTVAGNVGTGSHQYVTHRLTIEPPQLSRN